MPSQRFLNIWLSALWRWLPPTLMAGLLPGLVLLLAPDLLTDQRQLPAAWLVPILLAQALMLSAALIWLQLRRVRRATLQIIDQIDTPCCAPELAPLQLHLQLLQKQNRLQKAQFSLLTEQTKAVQPLLQCGQHTAGLLHEVNTPTQFICDNLTFMTEAADQLVPVLQQLRQLPAQTCPPQLQQQLDAMDLNFLSSELPAACLQAQRGAEQLKQLTDAARCWLHSGKQALQQQAVDLSDLLQQAATLTRHRWARSARLSIQAPDHLVLQTNPSRLLQVLINLIVNASDAIDRRMHEPADTGQIALNLSLKEKEVHIQVADNGCGIPPAIAQRLFEPFVTSKAPGKGTGLGLAICRDIVEGEQNGKLTAETTPGGGTTFTIELPAGSAP